jgi:hypothetical protein
MNPEDIDTDHQIALYELFRDGDRPGDIREKIRKQHAHDPAGIIVLERMVDDVFEMWIKKPKKWR